jgi:hypothetical protein
MADIPLVDVRQYVIDECKLRELVEAAACVANAIHGGAGGFIKATLMERELRDALGLKDGQMVNIPRGEWTGFIEPDPGF